MAVTHTLHYLGHTMVAFEYNPDAPGLPLILIHGISSTPLYFQEGLPNLVGTEVRTFLLTLPGHAPAIFPKALSPEEFTADYIADVLCATIRQLVGDSPFLVAGHSTGGFAALLIANKMPQQVKAVMSISGFVVGKWGPPLQLSQQFAQMGWLGRLPFRLVFTSIKISIPLFTYIGSFYTKNRQGYWQSAHLKSTMKTIFPFARALSVPSLWIWFNRMPHTDVTDWLRDLPMPVTALAGDSDVVVPTEQARIIAKTAPKGRLILMDGVGHLPMAENFDEYNQHLRAWLTENR